jgi:hypothetical protein
MVPHLHVDNHRDYVHAVSTPPVHLNQLAGQRRSQRVLLSIRVSVSGKLSNGQAFEEETSTLIVNAHGALIQLRRVVNLGDLLTVRNMKTSETLDCKVVDIRSGSNAAQEIGIEFGQPNPKFWHVSFPPADWSPRSPEAKRVTSTGYVAPKSAQQHVEKK